VSKDASQKYPTLRVRVTQDQYDKAYRLGWPAIAKDFINNTKEPKNGNQKENTTTNAK